MTTSPSGESFRLSAGQESLWFLAQLNPGEVTYHAQLAYELRGWFDRDAFQQSLAELTRRHPILRGAFYPADPPCWREWPEIAINPTLDVAPKEERDAQGLSQWILAQGRQPFDLARPPLFRVALREVTSFHQVLVITFHHAICDGTSLRVIEEELAELYCAARERRTALLPTPPVPYREFVDRQREQSRSAASEDSLRFWRRELEGAPQLFDFPGSRLPAAPSPSGRVERLGMPRQTTDATVAFARARSITLFASLLASYFALLFRLGGQRDFLMGIPVANRVGFPRTVGFLANVVVLRATLTPDMTFESLARVVATKLMDTLDHQAYPFERLVSQFATHRDRARNPLVQGVFFLDDRSRDSINLTDLQVRKLDVDLGVSRFDFSIRVLNLGHSLETEAEYRTDRFESATVQQILLCYHTLLDAAVSRPQAPLSSLPLISSGERRRIIGERNNTRRYYDYRRCLHDLVKLQAERTPDNTAVTLDGGGSLTYFELRDRASRLASLLTAAGIVRGDHVALLMERSLELVVAMLATLEIGAAYVPIDPDHPSQRVAMLLEDSNARMLLTQERLLPTSSGEIRSSREIRVIRLDTQWREVLDSPPFRSTVVGPDDVAYVMYTSGSTGQPKGVRVPHRAICNHLLWFKENYSLSPADDVLQKSNYAFDGSVNEFFAPLIVGAKLILAIPGRHRDPGYLASAVQRYRVTSLTVVPAQLQQLLDEPAFATCSTLRFIPCGGEAMTGALSRRLREVLPHAQLENLYGPTEATIVCIGWSCTGNEDDLVPIGRPFGNMKAYILDEFLEPRPSGFTGELCVAGPGVALGYHNRQELTRERFVDNPFSTDDDDRILYRTGDLARWRPDGNIEFLGRSDSQIKIRGQRVELGEIEHVLRRHPDVQQAAVFVQDRDIAACVVTRHDLLVRDLRLFLAQHLPSWMLPTRYYIGDSLPLTSTGKIDGTRLTALASPRPESIAACTPQERTLAAIWRQVLAIDGMGIDDDFFTLGGDSFRAVDMIRRASTTLGRRLDLAEFYAAPTIRALASLSCFQVSEVIALSPGQGGLPLFFMPPAGGNVECYRRLAELLPMACYGLRLPDDFGLSIEALAAHFKRLICEIQPTGPYRIGGWSLAGVIAFELARQFQTTGDEVELLVLLDTRSPLDPLPTDDKGKVASAVVAEVLRSLVPPSSLDTDTSRELGVCIQAQLEACQAFVPRRYTGKVVFVRTGDSSLDRVGPWKELASLTLLDAPGDHFSLLRDPYVRDLARILRNHIPVQRAE